MPKHLRCWRKSTRMTIRPKMSLRASSCLCNGLQARWTAYRNSSITSTLASYNGNWLQNSFLYWIITFDWIQRVHWLYADAVGSCCWTSSHCVINHSVCMSGNLLTSSLIPPDCSYYSVAIFCKLGVDGFLSTVVLFSLMLIVQIGGIFLVDKVRLT